MSRRVLLALLAAVACCRSASIRSEYQSRASNTCGYQSCAKSDPDKLNIHLVAHSHDDVGWLKTLDQYYFGARMSVQVAGVQYIIDSVIDSLLKDPSRRFIYVETAYLWKWWLRQGERKRDIARQLINEGRLEIIGGGWTMNDEATVHYRSMLDQYTWGFRRLNDTFGECARPKIGWQIDPFGHSREQASMFARLGFDGMLFGRLDYQDKQRRLKDKAMEFIWKASPSNLGQAANLFTSVLYNGYSAPPGFCFDILCDNSEPMIDDPDSPDYNIEKKVQQFLSFVSAQASSYRTNNVILTMGEDFNYQYAEMYFGNVDKLISGINKLNGTRYKAFYSTPSCYLKAVNEQNLTWMTTSDDFFPYASDPHAFWTGYFTSRPTLKYFERLANNYLQVAKQLSVLTWTPDSQELQLFREAVAVMQHHDAVSGTEKQHVAADYARILHRAMENAQLVTSNALLKWTTKKPVNKPPQFYSCLQLNISSCEHTANNSRFVVTVYNPTSQPLNTYVRLPVANSHYSVRDFNGKDMVTQVVPIAEQLLKLPGRVSSAVNELVFRAINIAPLGYQSFYISAKPNEPSADTLQGSNEIGRQNYRISVNANNEVFVTTPMGIEYVQSFRYYEGFNGNNKVIANRSSGAYIFRPRTNSSNELPATGGFRIFKGPLVEEIQLVVNDWVSQVVRTYTEEEFVEFDWLVGPIPIDNGIGKEVIVKYSSNLKNSDVFYTDSNGREMLKRKLNYRASWRLELNETISGNYYPVTAKISIEDEVANWRLSALNDRPQGGTSLKEGELELMVHRRLLHDDAFGVNEALNETAYGLGLVARGQHVLVVGNLKEQRDQAFLREKEQALKLSLRPWLFVTPTNDSFQEFSRYFNMRGEAVVGKVPSNLHILTLEPWRDNLVLLRLEHLFEVGESAKYSVPAQINIKDLFPNFHVQSVLETTLGANQLAKENRRLLWKAEENEVPDGRNTDEPSSPDDAAIVTLKPMQIRTFLVRLAPSKNLNASDNY